MTIDLQFTYTGAVGAVTIQWFKDDVLVTDGVFSEVTVTGATTTHLVVEDATSPEWDGLYHAQVTDSLSCIATTDDFTVNGSCSIHILTEPVNISDAEIGGPDVVLAFTYGGGTGPFTLQWSLNDTPISDGPTGHGSTFSGTTTDTLTIESIREEDAGVYSNVVVDANECSLEVEATVTTAYYYGPGMVPAYSTDSSIVLGSFAQKLGNGAGPLMTRRTPELAPSNILDLGVNGGAAWCPTNNKFYHGCIQTGPGDGGLAIVIDPVSNTFTPIYVTGADGLTGRFALWHPILGEIWIAVASGNMFLRIDPTDDSVIGYIAGAGINDLDYCTANDCVYAVNAGSVFKIDSSGAVTTVITNAGIGVPSNAFGSIAYVSSLNRVLFTVYAPGSGYFFAWQIDPATDVATSYMGGVGGSFMYYSPQFDRIILQATSDGTPTGLPSVLGSYLTDFTFVKQLDYGSTGISDSLTAIKGCYCTNVSKVALPVLQGPPGGRFYNLGFYGAGELT